MDSDDDILVLQSSPEDEVDSAVSIPFTALSPFHRSCNSDVDRGSHHALQKAYADVKRRLNESNSRNEQLSRKLQELESTKFSESYTGGSFDMMDDANLIAQGAADIHPSSEAQMAAEEGYYNNLQRQLARSKAQIQAVEEKYQASLQETDIKLKVMSQQLQASQSDVAQLTEDKSVLHRECAVALAEKQAAEKSVMELRERCHNLEMERDACIQDKTNLQLIVQKANQELASLQERHEGDAVGKHGDSLDREPPPELIAEVTNMRHVIEKLKKMVLHQRRFLENQGLALSMQSSMGRSLRNPPSVDLNSALDGSRMEGSPSTQSWEMVNGAIPSSLGNSDPQQTIARQQQQRAVALPVQSVAVSQLESRRALAATSVGGKAVNGLGDSVLTSSSSVENQLGGGYMRQKSKTDIIQRKKTDNVSTQPRSKTEMIRMQTDMQPQGPFLATWMGSHYQQQQQQGMEVEESGAKLHSGYIALNQLPQKKSPGPDEMNRGITSPTWPSQNVGMHFVPTGLSQLPHHTSVLHEPPSTYDNVVLTTTAAMKGSSTAPSMHILNQSGLAGARVIRNNSDSFGTASSSSVNSAVTLTDETDLTVPLNVKDGSARSSPQEHVDTTQSGQGLGDPGQFYPIHFTNQETGVEGSTASDRKCPVCGADFAHVSMDEFQTHVFECFDDVEESNAPETLQPQDTVEKKALAPNRVCPMCEKMFSQDVSQEFFEGHVQSHFEEAADHFEVLDVNRL